MEVASKTIITVEATVDVPVEKAWKIWNEPEHIKQWNAASDDWHTVSSTNDLREGGSLFARMEAKDGSFGFDFGGIYDKVIPNNYIAYTLGDGRKVAIRFTEEDNKTHISESFDAETIHSAEMQQAGWQAILNNFKKYAEQQP